MTPIHAVDVGRKQSGLGTKPHWLLRIRFQLFGGLLVAVLLPGVVRWAFETGHLVSQNLLNSITGAAIALTVGYHFHRRLTVFPGTMASAYILPTYSAVYAVLIVAFFFIRFDYSRFQFGASFFLTVAWFYGLSIATRRLKPHCLAIVPFGDVEGLRSIAGVDWRSIEAPRLGKRKWDGVVADLRADLSEAWERFIADCALSGIPVFHVKQIRESLTGRVEIEHLSENTLGALNPNQAYLLIKEVADWCAALVVLVCFAPLFAVVALLVRIDSPGPAFFRQKRMGYRGQSFTVYKFRTMTVGPSDGEDERDHTITKESDGRVTRIGRVLRKMRIDEFPQIINILRGEMSWIGPRPEAVPLSRWYEQELPFYRYRHIVRPGITGWAQVNQGHVSEVDEVRDKLYYDFYYIKNFSPWLDLLIVLRTIRTMLTGFGAR